MSIRFLKIFTENENEKQIKFINLDEIVQIHYYTNYTNNETSRKIFLKNGEIIDITDDINEELNYIFYEYQNESDLRCRIINKLDKIETKLSYLHK